MKDCANSDLSTICAGGRAVNAQELINAVAKEADLPKTAARRAVNAFTDTVQASVKSGQKVVLAGFGTFERTTRKARLGRNPKTGASIQITASERPKFRPGKTFKDMLISARSPKKRVVKAKATKIAAKKAVKKPVKKAIKKKAKKAKKARKSR